MMFYVAHKDNQAPDGYERMKALCGKLQALDEGNAYWSPLVAFKTHEYGDIGHGQEMELCLQFLCACDALIVASEPNQTMKREIDCARAYEIPVVWLHGVERPR